MGIVLDLIVIGIILFSVILSAKRGFVKVIVEVVGLIAAVILTFSISTPISNFTYDKMIEPPIVKAASSKSYESAENLVQNTWDSLPKFITANSERLSFDSTALPQSVTEDMQTNTEAAITNVSQQMIKPVAVKVLGLFFSVILMVVLFFFVKLLARMINKLFSFSVIGKVNRTLGGVVGAFKGFIFAVFFCTLISFIVSLTANGFLIFTDQNINDSGIFKIFTEIIPFNIF